MNGKKKFIVLSLIIGLFVLIIGFISIKNNFFSAQIALEQSSISSNEKVSNTPKANQNEPKEVKLIAFGDNLLHVPIINAAKTNNEAKYDFKPIFNNVKDKIEAADIAFINQETVTGGESFGISGYPQFNSPLEVSRDLAEVGFDVVNCASNHAMDKRGALEKSLENWKNYQNVKVIGAATSPQERDEIKVIEKSGLKIAFLAYTYGTNGIPVPKDKPYLVNLINKDQIKIDIDKAKKVSDMIIISMHWGEEYKLTQTPAQQELAKFLADEGVSLVIGHHPHVIEPVEKIIGKNGNEMIVVYSLGNMISTQREVINLLGGMLELDIKQENNAKILLEDVKITPVVTYCEIGFKNFRVVPINQYTSDMANVHGIACMNNVNSIVKIKETAKNVFGDYCNME